MSRHVILHVGDLHICSTHPRNADRLAALDQVIDAVRQIDDLAAIVIPGDLFHQKSTVEDRNALAPRLQDLAGPAGAPVVLTYGNHDAPGDLEIFDRLETHWPIYVVNRAHVLTIRTRTGIEAAIFVLRYPHKAGLVGAGVEHEQLGQTARELLEPIFIEAAATLEESAAAGALPLMIGHINVGGSTASSGQPQIGQELELDPALLARLGPIYKGLNHIHRHQTVAGAVYAGSVCRLDFGEREPKGFIEVEYQRDGAAWEHRWRFVPLDVPRMVKVVGRLTREAFTIREIDGETADGADASVWRGADIKVAYAYRKSEIGALDLAKIHAEFAEARSLVLDPQPELDHEVRAPEIAAAATLEDKVEAFCALNQIAVTDHVRACLAALQGNDSASLLAQVRTFAAAAGADEPVAQMSEVA